MQVHNWKWSLERVSAKRKSRQYYSTERSKWRVYLKLYDNGSDSEGSRTHLSTSNLICSSCRHVLNLLAHETTTPIIRTAVIRITKSNIKRKSETSSRFLALIRTSRQVQSPVQWHQLPDTVKCRFSNDCYALHVYGCDKLSLLHIVLRNEALTNFKDHIIRLCTDVADTLKKLGEHFITDTQSKTCPEKWWTPTFRCIAGATTRKSSAEVLRPLCREALNL